MFLNLVFLLKRIINKFSSYKNLLILRAFNIKHGSNCIVHGKVGLRISKMATVTVGNNFYMSSGGHNNPLCGNLEGFIYAEENASVHIGNNVGMSSTVLWASKSITIGNYVKIGANVKIIDTDAHSLDYSIRRNRKEDANMKSCSPIVIEDDVLIGMNSIVLKGVTIGARSVIGAGSVVVKSIPSDCIAAGNPCRVIKKINKEDHAVYRKSI